MAERVGLLKGREHQLADRLDSLEVGFERKYR